MLDVFVSRGCTDKPHFVLYKKPTSIWQPLGVESAHHASIHRHWPLAQCKRIRERFSSPVEAEIEVEVFKNAYFSATGVKIGEEKVSLRPTQNGHTTSWFVLPFSFVFERSRIPGILKSVVVPNCLGFDSVKVSYSLGSKHLLHWIRRKTSDPV